MTEISAARCVKKGKKQTGDKESLCLPRRSRVPEQRAAPSGLCRYDRPSKKAGVMSCRKNVPLPLLPSTRLLRHAPVRRTAERLRTSCLPCARGGGRRTPLGGVVGAAKRGCTSIPCAYRQPLSRALRDSTPCTGELRSGLPRQKICLFPRAWIASAGLHRGAGGDTYPWRNKNPRASGLHRPGTFAEKEIIFSVCGARLSGARRKGCAPLASPVQGEVGGGRRSEGLLRAAKRGHANIFYACRQPLSQPDG